MKILIFSDFMLIFRQKIANFVIFWWKISIKSEKSKFSKKPLWISSKSSKDYLVQISANLNKNCDPWKNFSEIWEFRIFSFFVIFSSKLVKILKMIAFRDLKWYKYWKPSWFESFCEILGLKSMYFWFYSPK